MMNDNAGLGLLQQVLQAGAALNDRASLFKLLSGAPGVNVNALLATIGQKLLRAAQVPPALVVATPGYERLAQGIVDAGQGFFELAEIERKRHSDGRPWQKLVSRVEGREVVVVGGWITDEGLMETYRTAHNVVLWKAKKLTIIIAHHGDARQERAQDDGEGIDALFATHMFTSIPPASGRQNEVVLVDIHADAVLGMFQGAGMAAINVSPLTAMIDRIIDNEFGGKCVLASPDAGRAKIVQKHAEKRGLRAAVANKDRKGGKTKTYGFLGNVRGQDVILSDDLAVSFGSAVGAGEMMKKKGARRLILVCAHLVAPVNPKTGESYVRDCFESGIFEKLYVSDSMGEYAYQLQAKYPDFLVVEPLAPILVPHLLG
jgi:ribose-phosphate pyrophosphokinase